MADNMSNGGLRVNDIFQSSETLNIAFENISGNVARLAETETRMEAFKLRNKILKDLEALKPVLLQQDLNKAAAAFSETENWYRN